MALMVVSESTDSSCWHKYTIGADRGGEIFDMLSRRGIGPVVPVPESAVDQFSGLSCARPQSGFAGKVSVLRTPLSSCPGLWPPSAVSSGLVHSHQHLLLGGACLHLVARPAHHDRHFLKTEPAPFTLSYYCLPFEALDRGPKPPLLLAPMGTGPSMPMWVCGFGGWCFLVWPGRKTRPARHAARVGGLVVFPFPGFPGFLWSFPVVFL